MDNASKNATDMIGSLQMQYNRGRQAAITNELVDIITGSSSVNSTPSPPLTLTLSPQVQVLYSCPLLSLLDMLLAFFSQEYRFFLAEFAMRAIRDSS